MDHPNIYQRYSPWLLPNRGRNWDKNFVDNCSNQNTECSRLWGSCLHWVQCRSYGLGANQRQQRYRQDLDLNASGCFLANLDLNANRCLMANAVNNNFNQQWKINSSHFGHFYLSLWLLEFHNYAIHKLTLYRHGDHRSRMVFLMGRIYSQQSTVSCGYLLSNMHRRNCELWHRVLCGFSKKWESFS